MILQLGDEQFRTSIKLSVHDETAKTINKIKERFEEKGERVISINKTESKIFVFTLLKTNLIENIVNELLERNIKFNYIELVNKKNEISRITSLGILIESKYPINYHNNLCKINYPIVIIPPNGYNYE